LKHLWGQSPTTIPSPPVFINDGQNQQQKRRKPDAIDAKQEFILDRDKRNNHPFHAQQKECHRKYQKKPVGGFSPKPDKEHRGNQKTKKERA